MKGYKTKGILGVLLGILIVRIIGFENIPPFFQIFLMCLSIAILLMYAFKTERNKKERIYMILSVIFFIIIAGTTGIMIFLRVKADESFEVYESVLILIIGANFVGMMISLIVGLYYKNKANN